MSQMKNRDSDNEPDLTNYAGNSGETLLVTPTHFIIEDSLTLNHNKPFSLKRETQDSLETETLLPKPSRKNISLSQERSYSTYGSLSSTASMLHPPSPLCINSSLEYNESPPATRPFSPCMQQLFQTERNCHTPTVSISNQVGQPTKAHGLWNSIRTPLSNISGKRVSDRSSAHRTTELLAFDGSVTHSPWGTEDLIYKWLQPALHSITALDSPATKTSFPSTAYESPPSQHSTFKNTVWIYLFNPAPSEIQHIGEVMDLHHLTIEDIVMQETRDKCELFPNYYLSSYSLSEFKAASIQPEINRVRKSSAYTRLPDCLAEEQLDLSEEYGSFDVYSLFNIVSGDAVVTFHYGNISLGKWMTTFLRAPSNVFEADWINCMILKRVTGRMDTQLSLLEKQIEMVDDFYLVGEDSDGNQPHYRGKGNQAIVPVRLDQLRAAVQLFDELLAPKSQMLRQLAHLIYHRVAVASPSLSCTAEIFLDLHPIEPPADNWKRRNKSLLPRPLTFTPRSLSPRLSPISHTTSPIPNFNPLPKLNSSAGERIVTLFLNLERKVTSMRVAVAHVYLVVERSFDLQRTHVDLAMTYRSIRQSNAMAELSGWTWVAGPLTLISTLIGINVLVPGQLAPRDCYYFEWYIVLMLFLGLSNYLVARRGGVM